MSVQSESGPAAASGALLGAKGCVRRTAIRSVTVEEPDLEAVFLHLTGKSLRD